MQVRVFTIPLFDNLAQTDEMNAFLRSQKVLTLDRQQVTVGEQAFWTFCVTYMPQGGYSNSGGQQAKGGKVDYKNVLDQETFAVFSRLRSIRKQLAEQDAIPAYAVFTDSELAEIAQLEHIDPLSIQTIQGIGQKKADKYGAVLCEKYRELTGDNAL